MQFVAQDGRVSAPFYFHQHLQHEAAVTWQVLRSEFDQMLLDNAREKGVEVREETEVARACCGRTAGSAASVRPAGKDGARSKSAPR